MHQSDQLLATRVLAYQRAKYLSVKQAIFYNYVTYLLCTILHNFNNFKINASNRLITPYIKSLLESASYCDITY